MDDHKLLELAAKATETQLVGLIDDMIAQPDHRKGGFIIRNDRGGDSCWNPLTDDGDALRLAVRLRLDATFHRGQVYSHKAQPSVFVGAYYGNDAYAATRRAIVLAAAEIGKNA